MSEIGKLIDQIGQRALSRPLKAAGFTKSGRTWRRKVDSAVAVLQIQASRRNEGAYGRFWLNAGVYFPALAERIGDFAPTTLPSESDCHVRTRPLPQGRRWWEVRAAGVAVTGEEDAGPVLKTVFSWLDRRADRRAPTRNDQVERELAEVLEQMALPWLERLANLRTARDELERVGPLKWAAAASIELGDVNDAVRLLERAISQQAEYAEELAEWGRRNGIFVGAQTSQGA